MPFQTNSGTGNNPAVTTQGFERLHKPLWELRKSLASAQAVAYHASCCGQALTGSPASWSWQKDRRGYPAQCQVLRMHTRHWV